MENSFFYFVSNKSYVISDVDACSKSEKTIDISFFDLANNESLLNKLHLYYIHGCYGRTYTYESRSEWFAAYLTSFSKLSEKRVKMYKKLKENPIIRLLILDETLFKSVVSVTNLPDNS
ncbi:MAG TPA: hypothetical protein PJ987_11650 [Bacteroidia bacterium]|nr:hypothetical protein [Bacteroidia bacterium]HMY42215.1 hypothetical protein [Chitinophagales bacterium]